jgi:hypothetical protein
MGVVPGSDPIVRTETRHGAPTGEGVVYVTVSGRRWRSDPSGYVVSDSTVGTLSSSGKFTPSYVKPVR